MNYVEEWFMRDSFAPWNGWYRTKADPNPFPHFRLFRWLP